MSIEPTAADRIMALEAARSHLETALSVLDLAREQVVATHTSFALEMIKERLESLQRSSAPASCA